MCELQRAILNIFMVLKFLNEYINYRCRNYKFLTREKPYGNTQTYVLENIVSLTG